MMKFSSISFLNPKITQFGIDLSDISIKIAQLKKTKKGYALSSFGRKEIAKGLIEEGEIKNEEKLVQLQRQVSKEKQELKKLQESKEFRSQDFKDNSKIK